MNEEKTPQINTFLFYVLYPAHVVVILKLILFPIFYDYSLRHFVYLFLGWVLIAGLGSAVTLHRIVSHRSVELRKGMKPVLLWIASLCLQGSPLGWAAIHRGSHHRFSDTDRDAHTPKKGIAYSYHFWLHDWGDYFNPKYAIDLLKDKTHLFFAHNYTKIIFISYIIIGLLNWEILLFMFIIPAVYSLHQESLVNTLCHLPGRGYRNFDIKDDSNNRPVLGYLFWGQAWHNNHHARASAYDFGTTVSGIKREFDPCLLFLPLIAKTESMKKIFEARKNAVANCSSGS
jgi:stearoyl-CoA desaturase (delta-9 desaturase)